MLDYAEPNPILSKYRERRTQYRKNPLAYFPIEVNFHYLCS